MKFQGQFQKNCWIRMLIIFSLFLLLDCHRDPCRKLERDADNIVKDAILGEVEFQEFLGQVQKQSTCSFVNRTSCEWEQHLSQKKSGLVIEKSTCSKTLPTLKVYIENSDSMDGYIFNGNDFKDSITNLIVRLKSQSSKTEFNYINSGIIPVKQSLEGFIKDLSPSGTSSYYRNKSNTFGSDLNSLFKKIVNSLGRDEVSVFITDGIYSVQESSNIQNELLSSQNFTMNTFIEAISEKNISTVVLQYESMFEGSYYDMRHAPHYIKSKKPFYVFIIGNKDVLDSLWMDKSTEIKKNHKLKNYSFFQNIKTNTVNSMVLSNYKKTGSRKIIDRYRGIIKNISLNTENLFQISLIADLTPYKGNDKLLDDTSNYKIPKYCSLEIENFDFSNLDSNDRVFLQKFTGTPSHIFTLLCNKNILAEEKLYISLIKQRSSWIKDLNQDSDISPFNWVEFKTFGLENLISGISDAYKELSMGESLFTIPIHIER
jgi:hypothetical protein